jgi:hypothetical protein
MTDEEIYHLWWTCNAFVAHPVITLSVMEKESSLVSNPESIGKYKWRHHRCMGYGLIYTTWNDSGKFYKYGTYEVQVHCGIKAIRKSFDRWYEKEYNCIDMKINAGKDVVQVDTVIDYILYRYTPYTHGKEDFMKIYKKFSERWGRMWK